MRPRKPRVRGAVSPHKHRAEPPKPEPPPSWRKEDLIRTLVPSPPDRRSANSSSNSRDPRLQKRDKTTPKRRHDRCKPIPLEPVSSTGHCHAAKQSLETGRVSDERRKRDDAKEPSEKQTTERKTDDCGADPVSDERRKRGDAKEQSEKQTTERKTDDCGADPVSDERRKRGDAKEQSEKQTTGRKTGDCGADPVSGERRKRGDAKEQSQKQTTERKTDDCGADPVSDERRKRGDAKEQSEKPTTERKTDDCGADPVSDERRKRGDAKEPSEKQTTGRKTDDRGADPVSGPSQDLQTPPHDASNDKTDSGAVESSARKQTATVVPFPSEAGGSSCGPESNNNDQSQVEREPKPVTSTALECIEEFRKFANADTVKAIVEKSLLLEMTRIENNSEYCDPLHDHTPDQIQQVSEILLHMLFE